MIRLEVDARGVARLTLARPEVRNAFDARLVAAIREAVEGLDGGVRVLVVAGEGKAFCAGADLGWMRSMAGSSFEDNVADAAALRRMLEALDACPAPKVARVQGACMAGGMGLVACCDVAVAAEGCVFAFTEVRLGLLPAVISPYVVRKVGYSFARAAFLSGERFDARRAYEAGLVHRVVPEGELDGAIEEYVSAFLAAGPQALRETRRLVDAVWGRPPAEVADLTVEAIARARVSVEGQEGMAAFFERRPPRWQR